MFFYHLLYPAKDTQAALREANTTAREPGNVKEYDYLFKGKVQTLATISVHGIVESIIFNLTFHISFWNITL